MKKKLTVLEAFQAMTKFLDKYYNFIKSDDLGSLLGDMQLLEDDNGTWDPAVWGDWIIALGNKKSVTEAEGFRAMFNFLHAYYVRTSSASGDIKTILDTMQSIEEEERANSAIWYAWIDCVKKNVL